MTQSLSCQNYTPTRLTRRNHQVNIDRGSDTMITEGLADHGANCQVGDVVVVHDVEVNNVGTGFQNIVDFFTEPGKVSRKDGRSDEVVLITPDIQRSLSTSRVLLSKSKDTKRVNDDRRNGW